MLLTTARLPWRARASASTFGARRLNAKQIAKNGIEIIFDCFLVFLNKVYMLMRRADLRRPTPLATCSHLHSRSSIIHVQASVTRGNVRVQDESEPKKGKRMLRVDSLQLGKVKAIPGVVSSFASNQKDVRLIETRTS